jgi:hypothetical protein
VIELLLGQDKVIKLLYDQPEPKMMQQNGDFPPISEEQKVYGGQYGQAQNGGYQEEPNQFHNEGMVQQNEYEDENNQQNF